MDKPLHKRKKPRPALRQPASRAAARNDRRAAASRPATPRRPAKPKEELPLLTRDQIGWPRLVITGLALIVAFAWAYWPTLVELVRAWDREADYSHGFLVAPLAIFFLYLRRDRFPGITGRLAWAGLALIGLSILVRYLGALVFIEAIDGWSIPIFVAGVFLLLGGWKVLWWALPSIAFLWFMVPLPYRVERWLSLPLQNIATTISTWWLQLMGQPAISEGHTILLNEHELEVEQACSGLRIFMSVVALAFAYLIVFRRSWWERLFLLACIVPIALIANATRIVGTGMLFQYTTGEVAHKFAHDVSGYLMIPFAAAMFGGVLWYLAKLLPEVEEMDLKETVKRA